MEPRSVLDTLDLVPGSVSKPGLVPGNAGGAQEGVESRGKLPWMAPTPSCSHVYNEFVPEVLNMIPGSVLDTPV